jgi:hypothetical protein
MRAYNLVRPMALWTFIADYRGGTYISQVKAGNVRQALVLWAKSFPNIQGSKIGAKTRSKLTNAAMEHGEKPVRIKETQGVWYWNPLSVRPPIVVHAIKTARF